MVQFRRRDLNPCSQRLPNKLFADEFGDISFVGIKGIATHPSRCEKEADSRLLQESYLVPPFHASELVLAHTVACGRLCRISSSYAIYV